MPRKADTNHKQIADAFRKMGYSVADTHEHGNGFPDFIAAKDGYNHMIEVKSETGKLTPAELRFAEKWQAPIYVIRSVEQAIQFESGVRKQF